MKTYYLSYLLSLFFLVFLFGCNNDDEHLVQEENCKIIKYDKIDFYDLETGQFTSEYLSQLNYEGGKITVRENYDLITIPSSGLSHLGLKFINKIYYDSKNRIEKVEYFMGGGSSSSRYDLFIYEGNSSKPYQRNRVENGYTWKEVIEYDEVGRIVNTTTYWEDDEFPSETTSFIYENNNLRRFITSNHNYNDGEIYEQWIYEYSNYDNQKNPNQLLSTPFPEDRVKQFSVNNFRKYIYWQSIPEDEVPSTGEWETSGYEYDENGYAKTVEFDCN